MDRLLTVQNAKTTKGEKLGILTGILYLAPANESGVMNTCASSTPECRHACLFTAGRGRFDAVRHGRIRKTLWLARDRAGFVAELKRNVTGLAPERFTSQAFWDTFEKILPEHLDPLTTGGDDPLDRAQLAVLDLWKEKQKVSRRLL